jgi:hypothetical protein
MGPEKPPKATPQLAAKKATKKVSASRPLLEALQTIIGNSKGARFQEIYPIFEAHFNGSVKSNSTRSYVRVELSKHKDIFLRKTPGVYFLSKGNPYSKKASMIGATVSETPAPKRSVPKATPALKVSPKLALVPKPLELPKEPRIGVVYSVEDIVRMEAEGNRQREQREAEAKGKSKQADPKATPTPKPKAVRKVPVVEVPTIEVPAVNVAPTNTKPMPKLPVPSRVRQLISNPTAN